MYASIDFETLLINAFIVSNHFIWLVFKLECTVIYVCIFNLLIFMVHILLSLKVLQYIYIYCYKNFTVRKIDCTIIAYIFKLYFLNTFMVTFLLLDWKLDVTHNTSLSNLKFNYQFFSVLFEWFLFLMVLFLN